MSEEKKDEALEQGEVNESKLDEVAGGMSTADSGNNTATKATTFTVL